MTPNPPQFIETTAGMREVRAKFHPYQAMVVGSGLEALTAARAKPSRLRGIPQETGFGSAAWLASPAPGRSEVDQAAQRGEPRA